MSVWLMWLTPPKESLTWNTAMGIKGMHEKSGSTEMWCIFRVGDVKQQCNCQVEQSSKQKTEEFGCQVEFDIMDESFSTMADTSFCSMKSTGI